MSTLTEVKAFQKRERAKRKAIRQLMKFDQERPRKWVLRDSSGNAVSDDTKPIEAPTAEAAALQFVSQMGYEVRAHENEDDGRCPHGMFYSGAGACPACGS